MAGDVLRKDEPVVLRPRPYRADGWRKVRIGEGADGDAHNVGQALILPEHGRTASGTEVEGKPGAAVTLPAKRIALAFHGENLIARKKGGRSEDRTSAALAGEAMARRHDTRLADRSDRQLATRAAGFARDCCSH